MDVCSSWVVCFSWLYLSRDMCAYPVTRRPPWLLCHTLPLVLCRFEWSIMRLHKNYNRQLDQEEFMADLKADGYIAPDTNMKGGAYGRSVTVRCFLSVAVSCWVMLLVRHSSCQQLCSTPITTVPPFTLAKVLLLCPTLFLMLLDADHLHAYHVQEQP